MQRPARSLLAENDRRLEWRCAAGFLSLGSISETPYRRPGDRVLVAEGGQERFFKALQHLPCSRLAEAAGSSGVVGTSDGNIRTFLIGFIGKIAS
jgi:hypothetical protein